MIGAMRKSIHTTEYGALCRELRAARDQAGLSQRELAKALRVPHSWVAKVETAERRIDLIEFCRFVTACDADPSVAFERIADRMPKPRKRGGRR